MRTPLELAYQIALLATLILANTGPKHTRTLRLGWHAFSHEACQQPANPNVGGSQAVQGYNPLGCSASVLVDHSATTWQLAATLWVAVHFAYQTLRVWALRPPFGQLVSQ